MPLNIRSFPKAILHIDGDAFFASCEVAMNPALRGKPVVTGKERGIASSMSYEAKAMGVKRAMTISQIKKVCPDAIILPSDYETYSLFSKRMFNIVRRYTPQVEEYSIDECFADLTGLRAPLHMSYEEMALAIKEELESELGMTFSLGLAPTKVLAKIGSRLNKPSGLTIIPGNKIEDFLKDLPVVKVWGIGSQTSQYLNKLGVFTALHFAERPREWVEEHMNKPYQEIWHELQGTSILPVSIEEKHDYLSISKTKTFTPSSNDREFVYSQLSKNVENACIKARRHNLAARKVFFFLKTQEFGYHGLEFTLTNALSLPHEIMGVIKENFEEVFRSTSRYRATGVVLMDLIPQELEQIDLFGTVAELSRWRRVYAAVDALDDKFGKHTVFLASTMRALTTSAHMNARGDRPKRLETILKGENQRQRLAIPMLGMAS